MIHTIQQPDWFVGGLPRRILWDDSTGDVSGDHSDVSIIRALIRQANRDGYLQDTPWGRLNLQDPAHDLADFHAILKWALMADYDRQALPPALRAVDPTPRLSPVPSAGAIV